MTVIAVDNRYIVADGLATMNGKISWTNAQKIRVVGNRIFALSGTAAAFGPAVDWYLKSRRPADVPRGLATPNDGWWMLLVIDNTGMHRYDCDNPWPDACPVPFATGIAHDNALGAMWHGASALEAVRLCCAHRSDCGGEIQVVDWLKIVESDRLGLIPAEASFKPKSLVLEQQAFVSRRRPGGKNGKRDDPLRE